MLLIFLIKLIAICLKIELEIKRHVLPQTKKLSDGKFEKIFTQNYRNENRELTYNCHLCAVANLAGDKLKIHINGKIHQKLLTTEYVPNAEKFRAEITQKIKRNLKKKIKMKKKITQFFNFFSNFFQFIF